MAEGPFLENPIGAAVPLEQILRTRQEFAHCALSHEVEIEGCDWPQIAGLAQLCAAADLRLLSLKCLSNGHLIAALGDDGRADLGLVAAELPRLARLLRWTTLIAC
ncbi:hypothetical protein GC209_18970 [bacterium]|nr:hypothetical protein [bacterium]